MIVATWLWSNVVFNVTTFWVWPLLVLASWRWSSFLVMEDGPFGMFMWVRVKRGVFSRDIQGNRMVMGPAFTAFACMKCMSVWTSLWLVLMPWPALLVFALSTAVIWLHARMP